jgi:phosphoribosylformimino-5-aminoimidazole carboxamide ribotide isomerase
MKIKITPAIDIIEGKCVRLTKGDYNRKIIYNEDPLEVAKEFEDLGVERLHLVDLDGAKASHIVNHKILEKIASQTNLIIDFGGGLKTSEDLRVAFESGAQMITGGSIAVKNEEEFLKWLSIYSNEKIILGADFINGKIATDGWLESSDKELKSCIAHFRKLGIKKVISTDVSKDGMLEGPAIEVYQELIQEDSGLYLIASGGVSCNDDILKLDEIGIPEVIVGKAIYENKISLKDLIR